GKEILERKLKSLKITYNTDNILKLSYYFKLHSTQDVFYNVAKGLIDLKDLKEFVASEKVIEHKPQQDVDNEQIQTLIKQVKTKDSDILLIGEDMQKIDYKLANCCNPIPGDDVFGFVTVSDGIKIHRTNCPNATKLMSSFGYRIVKAKWTSQKQLAFLTGLKITGIDEVGLINNLTQVISTDFKVNMRSITVDSDEGIFNGTIMIYVNDTQHLDNLIEKLKEVKGITDVSRFDSETETPLLKS
ncbi:MAG: ACT domain-containing protein, partial [Pelobium sp.]